MGAAGVLITHRHLLKPLKPGACPQVRALPCHCLLTVAQLPFPSPQLCPNPLPQSPPSQSACMTLPEHNSFRNTGLERAAGRECTGGLGWSGSGDVGVHFLGAGWTAALSPPVIPRAGMANQATAEPVGRGVQSGGAPVHALGEVVASPCLKIHLPVLSSTPSGMGPGLSQEVF